MACWVNVQVLISLDSFNDERLVIIHSGATIQPTRKEGASNFANKLLWQQIYRTRWTGEFSSFGALHYGVKIKHPFWNLKLISYCLNLDPALKIANGEVKTFIREYVHIQHLLPEVITWRKKIGIHEGSSKNKIFARIIGVDSSDYEAKTLFTYQLYKKFLTCDLIPEEFDASEYAPLMM